jgi:hypothetical protein
MTGTRIRSWGVCGVVDQRIFAFVVIISPRRLEVKFRYRLFSVLEASSRYGVPVVVLGVIWGP